MLLKKEHTVIIQYSNENCIIMKPNTFIPPIPSSNVSGVMMQFQYDTNAIWIIDTVSTLQGPFLHPEVLFFTILFASINPRKTQDFVKESCVEYVLPVWSDDEMEDLRGKSFPHISAHEMRSLVKMYGNSPRHVLQNFEKNINRTSILPDENLVLEQLPYFAIVGIENVGINESLWSIFQLNSKGNIEFVSNEIASHYSQAVQDELKKIESNRISKCDYSEYTPYTH